MPGGRRLCPGSHATHALGRDADHRAGRRVVDRRELHPGGAPSGLTVTRWASAGQASTSRTSAEESDHHLEGSGTGSTTPSRGPSSSSSDRASVSQSISRHRFAVGHQPEVQMPAVAHDGDVQPHPVGDNRRRVVGHEPGAGAVERELGAGHVGVFRPPAPASSASASRVRRRAPDAPAPDGRSRACALRRVRRPGAACAGGPTSTPAGSHPRPRRRRGPGWRGR